MVCRNDCPLCVRLLSAFHLLLTMSSSQEQEDISAEDEVEDSFTDEEEDLGAVEEERSVILHLLSQLKLGMDLTRVGRVPPKATAIQPPPAPPAVSTTFSHWSL